MLHTPLNNRRPTPLPDLLPPVISPAALRMLDLVSPEYRPHTRETFAEPTAGRRNYLLLASADLQPSIFQKRITNAAVHRCHCGQTQLSAMVRHHPGIGRIAFSCVPDCSTSSCSTACVLSVTAAADHCRSEGPAVSSAGRKYDLCGRRACTAVVHNRRPCDIPVQMSSSVDYSKLSADFASRR